MKTKSWLPAIFIFHLVFISIFNGNCLAKEPSSDEKTNLAEVLIVEKHKPDISMEVVGSPPQDSKQDIEDEFEEDDFAAEDEEIYDPIEPLNRMIWSFNEKLYDHVMEPVARGYGKAIPEPLRIMVQNFFSNLSEPVALVSSAAQNNKDKVDRSIGRFLINSTLGIGGVFDPADKIFNIKKVNEDIDQALGYHDVPSGAYIMLPIFGPSTTRGVVGKVFQALMSPEYIFGIDFLPTVGIRSEETVNDISLNLDRKEDLDSFALDKYTSVKDFYIQNRKALVKE